MWCQFRKLQSAYHLVFASHSKIILQVRPIHIGVIKFSVKFLTNTAILACWLVQFWHLLRQVSILMNLISWENSWAARCKVEIGTVFRSRIWYTLFRDKVFEKIAKNAAKFSRSLRPRTAFASWILYVSNFPQSWIFSLPLDFFSSAGFAGSFSKSQPLDLL